MGFSTIANCEHSCHLLEGMRGPNWLDPGIGHGIPIGGVASNHLTTLQLIRVFPKMVGFPPKSSILIGFSIINHPFWGTPIFGNTHTTVASNGFHEWKRLIFTTNSTPPKLTSQKQLTSARWECLSFPKWQKAQKKLMFHWSQCFLTFHLNNPPFQILQKGDPLWWFATAKFEAAIAANFGGKGGF